MKSISVAIITYNEERNIEACIRSCEAIADEIVILDSHSTDRTAEVARKFGKVRFKTHAFDGHVEQKNRAMAMCRNDWILSIDADERVSPALAAEIADIEPGDRDGFRMPRLTFHMGRFIRHSGWYPQKKYRLFRKTKARWVGENPHDFIVIDGPGADLKGDLIHYSFSDLSQQIDTINKFSSIVSFTRFHSGRSFGLGSCMFKPLSKFLEIYLFKQGFRDGFPGFAIAVASAFSTFLKFAKVYELDHKYIERPSNLRPDYQPQKRRKQ